jgi:hypothetical protein
LSGYAIFFANFREIFASFGIIFGAVKRMQGLPKTVPFFVVFCAAQKNAIFAKKIAKSTLVPKDGVCSLHQEQTEYLATYAPPVKSKGGSDEEPAGAPGLRFLPLAFSSLGMGPRR